MCEQQAVYPDGVLKRRSFLGGAIYAMTSLIGGTLITFGGRYLFGTPHKQQSNWIDAGEVPDFQVGSPREVNFKKSRTDGWETHNEQAIAWVVLNHDQNITAFSPFCTHLGCAYKWQANQGAFVCPCHSSKFAADGSVISGPANRPLDQYRVKVEGARLWLEI